MDTSTITESTFSLTGPGQNSILTPELLAAEIPDTLTSREYITGKFSFSQDDQGRTVLQFNQVSLSHGKAKPSRTRGGRGSGL